ncbi:hypothetical protein M2263_000345 [Providencia alcalifaciens]|nr:hypothetical protein [Providencia alcalifaciens]
MKPPSSLCLFLLVIIFIVIVLSENQLLEKTDELTSEI